MVDLLIELCLSFSPSVPPVLPFLFCVCLWGCGCLPGGRRGRAARLHPEADDALECYGFRRRRRMSAVKPSRRGISEAGLRTPTD